MFLVFFYPRNAGFLRFLQWLLSQALFRNFPMHVQFHELFEGNILIWILCIFVSYFIGSIPTAYLVVRLRTGKDIRKTGSGNVGAFNSFDVTGSKGVGVIVGVLDVLKGFFVAFIAGQVMQGTSWFQAAAFFSVLIGHIYPVWLRFHGGRGLASAAGGSFAIGIAYTLLWIILWFVFYRITKDITKANVVAIILSPLVLIFLPAAWIDIVMMSSVTVTEYQILAFTLSVVLLLSHWDVLKGEDKIQSAA
jgi:acyl phosphate:glycerol-3-phosphate acyltransferase